MFRHTPRNDLPSVKSNNKPNKADKQVNKDDQKRKDKIGEYANNKRKTKSVTVAVSDKVHLKNIHHANKLNTIWENQTYTVLKVNPRSPKLQNDNTRSVYVRSKVHIKMYHQQPHKSNAQTSSRHRSHYQADTDINSEWKLQILPLEPDIEIPDQPLEEIEKESSGSEENVESSDSDKKVEKDDSYETVEYDIQ